MNSNQLLTLALSGFFLQSCVQSVMKDHSFKKTEAVEINGAKVKSALKPLGGKGGISLSAMIYAAGTGTLDGPFRWRVEAEGAEGEHEWIRVNQARVTTEKTKRSEPYPRKYLGSQAKFVPIPGEEGKTFAKFEIPGKLTVFPRDDGKTKIHLDVSVRAKGRTELKWILFELEPESEWKTESIFLPAEIVKSLRGNPREWDW
ncbi:hypothetical protein N9Z23_01865 [Akkermansiaceae bacterium]|nr:hypothetical protein [Akkermansiaceae bacterium]MDB4370015.1 hypothetical protein [Akkermansiaceae bacterium]